MAKWATQQTADSLRRPEQRTDTEERRENTIRTSTFPTTTRKQLVVIILLELGPKEKLGALGSWEVCALYTRRSGIQGSLGTAAPWTQARHGYLIPNNLGTVGTRHLPRHVGTRYLRYRGTEVLVRVVNKIHSTTPRTPYSVVNPHHHCCVAPSTSLQRKHNHPSLFSPRLAILRSAPTESS